MAFIKLDDIVINTACIAAIELECQTHSGDNGVSVLIAVPEFQFVQKSQVFHNPHHYERLEFTGRKAEALRDYFSSLNNVIDLLPSSHCPVACSNSYFSQEEL